MLTEVGCWQAQEGECSVLLNSGWGSLCSPCSVSYPCETATEAWGLHEWQRRRSAGLERHQRAQEQWGKEQVWALVISITNVFCFIVLLELWYWLKLHLLLYYVMAIINDKHKAKKIIKKPRFSQDFWTSSLGVQEEVIREGQRGLGVTFFDVFLLETWSWEEKKKMILFLWISYEKRPSLYILSSCTLFHALTLNALRKDKSVEQTLSIL